MLSTILTAALLSVAAGADQHCTCGPYSYTLPGASGGPVPGPYTKGIDYPGDDMPPCNPQGCQMPAGSTHLDCEKKCNATSGCVAYIYDPLNCDGNTEHAICWLKSALSSWPGDRNACRNARILKPVPDNGHGWPACPQVSIYADGLDVHAPLPEYPRPQMVRRAAPNTNWTNLNGNWSFAPTTWADRVPTKDTTYGMSITVPFPPEACLSGVWVTGMGYDKVPTDNASNWMKSLHYRRVFDKPVESEHTYLHFGAVDWFADVWLNGVHLGNHTGGYSRWSLDATHALKSVANELVVYTYDPSDYGRQVFGKQRVSAITNAGGDTYTPTSGIWQTVWLEDTRAAHVADLRVDTDTEAVTVAVECSAAAAAAKMPLRIEVLATAADPDVPGDAGGAVIATATSACGKAGTTNGGGANTGVRLAVPAASRKLWAPGSPHLYGLVVTLLDPTAGGAGDAVESYFGLREFSLGQGKHGRVPLLNGAEVFAAGWLDQSWWPDGQYRAPTDEALKSDITALGTFGLNMVRLHQKVNPARWYYHADRAGVLVFQDMVQHYGDPHGVTPSPALYMADLEAMIHDVRNHPSVVQFETFNEGDMVGHFSNVSDIVKFVQGYAPGHLVDTDSGGPANNLHVGDVDDIHDYPWPQHPMPSKSQYAMIGEFGGIGAFIKGKEWYPGKCHTYLQAPNASAEAALYVSMVDGTPKGGNSLLSVREDVRASVYTQITDVELECDGFLNYDRSNKFDAADVARIAAANQALIAGTGAHPRVSMLPPKENEEGVADAPPKVSKVCVTNNAGFVLHWEIDDLLNDAKSADSGSYPIDQTRCLGVEDTVPHVADGDVLMCRVHADGGVSHACNRAVIFSNATNEVATFTCTGTTLDYSCTLDG